ncbi:hypothetical protein LZ32DRAFT_7135 [Colletotrichum eremochloae]|nr:hypothetical protein LZ32DRAFT_7135 [Colletotrichum eremochloae]
MAWKALVVLSFLFLRGGSEACRPGHQRELNAKAERSEKREPGGGGIRSTILGLGECLQASPCLSPLPSPFLGRVIVVWRRGRLLFPPFFFFFSSPGPCVPPLSNIAGGHISILDLGINLPRSRFEFSLG